MEARPSASACFAVRSSSHSLHRQAASFLSLLRVLRSHHDMLRWLSATHEVTAKTKLAATANGGSRAAHNGHGAGTAATSNPFDDEAEVPLGSSATNPFGDGAAAGRERPPVCDRTRQPL